MSRRFLASSSCRIIQVYGADSYMQHYPLLLYSGVPIVASFGYDFLARTLNDFEEHPTPVRRKNALIIKVNQERLISFFFSFLFRPIYYLSPCFLSLLLIVGTQIRCHIAGSSPPSPPGRFFFFATRLEPFRLASSCAYLTLMCKENTLPGTVLSSMPL